MYLRPSANFGAAVAGDGDLNKDGYSDWLVGAPNDPSLASGAGRAFAFKGGRGGIPGLGAITWAISTPMERRISSPSIRIRATLTSS